MMAWLAGSLSTSITSERRTSDGATFAAIISDWRRSSAALRSRSRGGASDQKISLYAGAALQKQVRQFVQTTVRSRVRQLHQSASAASKTTRQLAQMTSYRRGTASASAIGAGLFRAPRARSTTSSIAYGRTAIPARWMLGMLDALRAVSTSGSSENVA